MKKKITLVLCLLLTLAGAVSAKYDSPVWLAKWEFADSLNEAFNTTVEVTGDSFPDRIYVYPVEWFLDLPLAANMPPERVNQEIKRHNPDTLTGLIWVSVPVRDNTGRRELGRLSFSLPLILAHEGRRAKLYYFMNGEIYHLSGDPLVSPYITDFIFLAP